MADVKNLGELNKKLLAQSFVKGFTLTADDFTAFDQLDKAPDAKAFPNVARWYRNIASYSASERKSYTGGSSSGAAAAEKDEDEDIDLFGSDDEDDEEKERVKQERLKAYAEKKSKKPGPIAKSTIIFDVKPWDDTVDIAEIEKNVRGIEIDGLVWGASKILPVAFGINKLQISCVVEDDKVSTDVLEEQITGFEDLVQSVDIVAFNKI